MPDPVVPEPKQTSPNKPVKGPGKGDVAAIGIGCLVFLIFIAAIITVGVMRE